MGDVAQDISERELYGESVQIIQLVETEYVTDDLFRTSQLIESGLYTVPCDFDYRVTESYRMLPGGVATEAEAFLMANKKWESSFKKDLCYVKYDDNEYEIVKIDYGVNDDGILVQLKRR